jgi:2',3'-cyclic-nucleotide 2'-phosphodiesterase (5'-nucleotidase family)
MKDIFLQIERDPDIQKLLEGLTEEERSVLLLEMKQISDNFSRSIESIRSKLNSEEDVINLINDIGSAIGESDIGSNIGTEVIKWPEKR